MKTVGWQPQSSCFSPLSLLQVSHQLMMVLIDLESLWSLIPYELRQLLKLTSCLHTSEARLTRSILPELGGLSSL